MEEKKNLKQIVKENWKLWLAIAGGIGSTALAGIVFYILVANIFSLILFLVFLVVNTRAAITWYKLYKLQQ